MLLSKYQPPSTKNIVSLLASEPSSDARLTLISAPAGFGKSTLAIQLTQNKSERTVWLSLDERDNDLSHFVRCMVNGLRQIEPTVGEDALNALYADHVPSPETLAALIINSMIAIQEGMTLVLDDYHLIHNPAVHEFMVFTIANTISGFQFIITTRHDPQFPARWRARGWVHEIRADNLRFSHEMATAFLNGQMNLGLTEDEVDVLVKRTEG